MKTSRARFLLPLFFLSAIIVFFACQKESSHSAANIPAGKQNFSVYLTDGPYDFQKVLIDIKSVQVLVDTCHHFGDPDDDRGNTDHQNNEGDNHDGEHRDDDKDSAHAACEVWSDLQITPGIYDLLKLRNGRDTLLGSSFVPNGKIRKIKITLGTDNSIMADSITSPLKIRDDKNFVIIKIRNEHLDSISRNNFQSIIDFDLARSIKFEDGVYWLKPVLRVFAKRNTGAIEGKVGPENAFGLVKAFNATDTAYALPEEDEDGEFKVRGLNAGTYSVWFQGINGYVDSTVNNVLVSKGEDTKLEKVVLHK